MTHDDGGDDMASNEQRACELFPVLAQEILAARLSQHPSRDLPVVLPVYPGYRSKRRWDSGCHALLGRTTQL